MEFLEAIVLDKEISEFDNRHLLFCAYQFTQKDKFYQEVTTLKNLLVEELLLLITLYRPYDDSESRYESDINALYEKYDKLFMKLWDELPVEDKIELLIDSPLFMEKVTKFTDPEIINAVMIVK